MEDEAWHEAWLHATPQWVEAYVNDALDYRGWSLMGVGHPASEQHLERFKGVLPASVVQLWRRFGFDGFGDGRWWFTDPLEWQPVVDAWLADTPIPLPQQKWWVPGPLRHGQDGAVGGGLRPRTHRHPHPGLGTTRLRQRPGDVRPGDT
ncbi:GAD-like domain-containing protein [Actinomyces procaprae]|uniref:GAD-like domain-containing protein n=1 Tax=Actinomyces procaprae TaxID=2560010 RepID=UPI003B8338ED